ncbi:MAG TPA: hypothetical protein VGY58_10560 [Gemmataceae bacterium]|nr:hypothetical protein [Gemmataceae bacterium]
MLCRNVLHEFTDRFGHELRRPLMVYFFASSGEMSVLFRNSFAAAAVIGGDLIVLGADAYADRAEVIRHELAHLFSSYWRTTRPRFLEERLATWLMQTLDGKPIDLYAILALVTDRYLFLNWLLDPWVFYYRSQQSYVLAGSFTGWLIDRFGWDRYRDYYRSARQKHFTADFEKIYGLSLLAAERQWREQLLQKRPAFEPEVTQLLPQHRIESALVAGHFYRLLEESAPLIEAGKAGERVLSCAAWARALLGDYAEAAVLLIQALEHDDARERSRGPGSFSLANLYDLQARRDEAIQEYQKVLLEPDDWHQDVGSLHAAARTYLKRPFTESDLKNLMMRTPLFRVRDEARAPLG